MDLSQIDYAPILLALAEVVLGVIVLIIARLVKDWLSPYSLREELTARDNPAFGLALAGYYVAVVAMFIGVARAHTLDLDNGSAAAAQALAIDFGWALAGILALTASRWAMDRLLIAGCCHSREIVERRNTAAGAVECGVYVASGLVLAGALREPGGSPLTALVFFLLSQGVLLAFGRLYQKFGGYDVAGEVRSGNTAAGTAFAFTLVAIALLMLKATSGEFVGWTTNLLYFGFDAVVGFAMLMILRQVTDGALLPQAKISEEIARDRNLSVGLIEGVLAAGVAGLILFVF